MIVIVMGVAGSGKTTIGRRLAEALGWSFHEGDDLHPPANLQKMAAGIPLTDADRLPWLQELRRLIERCLAAGEDAVIACSALKASYREILAGGLEGVRFVHLAGSPELIRRRLERRQGHFMKPGMLASQLAALEPPAGALTVDVAGSPEEIVEEIRGRLGSTRPAKADDLAVCRASIPGSRTSSPRNLPQIPVNLRHISGGHPLPPRNLRHLDSSAPQIRA